MSVVVVQRVHSLAPQPLADGVPIATHKFSQPCPKSNDWLNRTTETTRNFEGFGRKYESCSRPTENVPSEGRVP